MLRISVPVGLCLLICVLAGNAARAGSLNISVPNGHVYSSNGNFITTSFAPSQTVTANFVTMNCLDDNNSDSSAETFQVAITTDSAGNNVIASAQITNDFDNTGGCDAHRYSFDVGNVSLTGGATYYLRTKVLAGAPVRSWAGATLYFDGGLPDFDRLTIGVPNGQTYLTDGSSITTSFSIATGGTGHFVIMDCLDDGNNDSGSETFEVAITTDSAGNSVIASARLTNNFRNTGGCDQHLYLFDFTDVSLAAGTTYYLRTKVLTGAPVRSWGADRLYYTSAVPECTQGPCCDGAGRYRPAGYVCEHTNDWEYLCYTGECLGDDVWRREWVGHCSGSSEWCDGSFGWDDVQVWDACGGSEFCDSDLAGSAPFSCSTAQCTSGSCCDSSCGNYSYEPSSMVCDSSVGDYTYGCPDGQCEGDNVKRRDHKRYCSGSSSSCNGALAWNAWQTYDDCNAVEFCDADNAGSTPFTCSFVQCTGGPCCNSACGDFSYKPASTICDSLTTQKGCPDGQDPGDDVKSRTRYQYCPGNAGTCTGAISWSAWHLDTDCNSGQTCAARSDNSNAVCTSIKKVLAVPLGWSKQRGFWPITWIESQKWQSQSGFENKFDDLLDEFLDDTPLISCPYKFHVTYMDVDTEQWNSFKCSNATTAAVRSHPNSEGYNSRLTPVGTRGAKAMAQTVSGPSLPRRP
jgi:hypothetical protein